MNDRQLTQSFEAQHPRLIESLYNTSTDHRQWNAFLLELVQATASRSARLLVTNAQADEVLYSTKVNIDDSEHQRYVEHFVNTCPWRTELGQKPIGSLYSTYYDFSCDQQAFYQTEFFNDWARHLDIHHGVCGTVYKSGAHKVQMLVQRTRQQGHFSHQTTGLINGLLPHVRQALRLSQQQAAVNHTLHGASLAAEARALPFVLLDERGRICHLSNRADLLLQEQSLQIVDGELVLNDPLLQRDYQAGIRQVLASTQAIAGSEYAFRLPRSGRAPLDCLVTPIHPAANALNLWPSPGYAALYIYDREQHLTINPAILSQIFDLTDSEARIAADIARGMDPGFIAERDNRSPHTVRAQLKSVFHKTRCHRQSQLTALVLQSPAAVLPGSAPEDLRSGPET
ncbi:helix-turn-helix transcriptional regulator [Marinimicrobium alkaliphilum]|uniref:helix-turn-helix transcriptional regulator n=1 Tax=Marinimicrobium alkaliphilum TaxID=2202654 RepID=UPI000DBA2083|nr:helix-turn-helix transcriptional regulator [Marinimicrobium alkaliphilum]